MDPAMSTSSKVKVSFLELVFPPISNHEAVQVKNEPALEHRLRQSDFYMIGGKPQGTFKNISLDDDSNTLKFDFCVGEEIKDTGSIDLLAFLSHMEEEGAEIRTSSRFIDFVRPTSDGSSGLVMERFTPEGILWHKTRGTPGILGLNKNKELSTYDLLYVGIAKVGDSYDRLLAKGHLARMEILANEPQRYPGARVSDETFLFLFKIEPLFISTYRGDHEFTDQDISPTYDPKRIVADAEKAFVSLLQPQYNVVKFKKYPGGTDGLYNSGLDRYGYSIGESLTFNSVHGRIVGGRHLFGGMTNSADFIMVDGEQVNFYIAGEDFPATDI